MLAGGVGATECDAKGLETTPREKDAQAPTFVGCRSFGISQSFLPAACAQALRVSFPTCLFILGTEGGVLKEEFSARLASSASDGGAHQSMLRAAGGICVCHLLLLLVALDIQQP